MDGGNGVMKRCCVSKISHIQARALYKPKMWFFYWDIAESHQTVDTTHCSRQINVIKKALQRIQHMVVQDSSQGFSVVLLSVCGSSLLRLLTMATYPQSSISGV